MKYLALLLLSIFISGSGCPDNSGTHFVDRLTGPAPVVTPPLESCPYYGIVPKYKSWIDGNGFLQEKGCIYRDDRVFDYTDQTETGRLEIQCIQTYGVYGFKLWVAKLGYCL